MVLTTGNAENKLQNLTPLKLKLLLMATAEYQPYTCYQKVSRDTGHKHRLENDILHRRQTSQDQFDIFSEINTGRVLEIFYL